MRLLTLTGPGGAGKTRLALTVARELAPEFPGGVWFVPLAALADPNLVAGAIARVLGVQKAGGTPLVAALILALHDRVPLLVLDNLEHLPDAATLVAELLAGASGLTVLATSRAPLHVSGERLLDVPPLAVPAEAPLPIAQLGEVAAVHLFTERARAVQSDFSLTEENAAAVAEICRRPWSWRQRGCVCSPRDAARSP